MELFLDTLHPEVGIKVLRGKMKLFKNFQTKKQLKEENIKLKALLSCSMRVYDVERNIQKVQSSFAVSYHERDIPEEIIKRQIEKNMIDVIKPFIDYDIKDDGNGGKICCGYLYVADKK